MNIAKFLTYSTSVIALLVLLVAPAHAQSAIEQLGAAAGSGQEAVAAPAAATAKDVAGQVFDTPVSGALIIKVKDVKVPEVKKSTTSYDVGTSTTTRRKR